jgi:hypothetical protein
VWMEGYMGRGVGGRGWTGRKRFDGLGGIKMVDWGSVNGYEESRLLYLRLVGFGCIGSYSELFGCFGE